MEGEINNLILVWMTILASICFCHTIGKLISHGIVRFLAIIPIVCLFLLLPLKLSSSTGCGITSFFIAWLANFKLLLYAFGQGPLSANPPLPLSVFIAISCLPIKMKNSSSSSSSPPRIKKTSSNIEIDEYPSHKISQSDQETPPNKSTEKVHTPSFINYRIKILLLFVTVPSVYNQGQLHPKFVLLLYFLQMYLSLELLLAMFAAMARALAHVELEPQFDEPYLATSLQDFWGRRWNLTVSSILHLTVYLPVRSLCLGLIPGNWAVFPAIVATFLVSGLMHELMFFYLGRLKPTGETTCYFLIHGTCLAMEIGLKKKATSKGKFRLPPAVSRTLVLGFVVATTLWLFAPPYLRCRTHLRTCRETLAVVESLKQLRLVSPSDTTSPFM